MRPTGFLRCYCVLLFSGLLQIATTPLLAEPYDPSAADYTGRKGATLYVSKLGDNSDGTSWQKAFHTLQAALLSVPDDKGGHTIIIRPDTYFQHGVYSVHKGAPGSYNLLVGDCDGRLGSGATGRVVLDTSVPDKGNVAKDWWGLWRASPDGLSCIDWDRWIFRNFYTAGSEGVWHGLCGESFATPFTIIVEDCVGMGRFVGTSVESFLGREKEPCVFRRCYFMNLDWYGDCAAVYVRAEHKTMPDYPDVIFDDCTLVGPDNAVQVGNPGFTSHTRLKFKNCRLIVLNFSHPHGTPSTGIICSTMKGDFLHVDLEDCDLMGYKVFGVGQGYMGGGARRPDPKDPGKISYTTKGRVRCWVQWEQSVPEGFERFHGWPTELFDAIKPPIAGSPQPTDQGE